MSPEQVSEVIKYCRENMCTPNGSQTFFLCGYEPEPSEFGAVGVFVADEAHQKRLGAPPNKTRLMIYTLCGDCHESPDQNRRVQEKVFADVRVQ